MKLNKPFVISLGRLDYGLNVVVVIKSSEGLVSGSLSILA